MGSVLIKFGVVGYDPSRLYRWRSAARRLMRECSKLLCLTSSAPTRHTLLGISSCRSQRNSDFASADCIGRTGERRTAGGDIPMAGAGLIATDPERK